KLRDLELRVSNRFASKNGQKELGSAAFFVEDVLMGDASGCFQPVLAPGVQVAVKGGEVGTGNDQAHTLSGLEFVSRGPQRDFQVIALAGFEHRVVLGREKPAGAHYAISNSDGFAVGRDVTQPCAEIRVWHVRADFQSNARIARDNQVRGQRLGSVDKRIFPRLNLVYIPWSSAENEVLRHHRWG